MSTTTTNYWKPNINSLSTRQSENFDSRGKASLSRNMGFKPVSKKGGFQPVSKNGRKTATIPAPMNVEMVEEGLT